MQFIKILLWVLLLVGSFIFWWSNESRSSLDLGAAIVEARVSTFVLGAFLIGFLPTWLILRGSRWRLTRRIKTLEAAARPVPATTSAPQDADKEPAATAETKPAEAKPAAAEPKPAVEAEPVSTAKDGD